MVLSMDRWKGKIAVVTGASAGIGAAVAEQLVDAGMKVVGFARRKNNIEQLAEKLHGRPGKLFAVQVDMTKEAEILAGFEWIRKNLPGEPVHVLINNAGVLKNTTLIDGDTELWRQVFDTNVMGLCIATREAIKDMMKHTIDGHIVHINSVTGHKVVDLGLNVYPASKFAVTALAETLRHEFNRVDSKIKITSISPGAVDTEIITMNNMPIEFQDLFKNKINKVESADVADAVVYVLSTSPNVLIQELIIRPILEKY